MTSPAPHLDEQGLSELVDGAGSANDREHVETCTECKARLDAMRYVTRAVASAPAVSETKREEAVQAALAEFVNLQGEGGSVEGDAGSGEMPSVADLDAHRARRRRLVAVRVAAAAALVTIGGVSALVAESGGGSSHVAGRTAATVPRSTAEAGSAAGAPSQPAPAGSSVAQLRDLGSIGSDAQLVAVLKANTPSSPALSPSSASQQALNAANPPCHAPAASDGKPVLSATLRWKGTPALAFVYATTQGHTAVVESSSTCKVLAAVTY